MIDPEKKQALITGQRDTRDVAKERVAGLTPDELVALREYIDELLPAKSLANINLEHELVDQFEKVKKLQQDVLNDEGVQANQKAQVANSVAATLQQLIKMQSEYHTAERFKMVENLMIKAIKGLPKEVAEKFVEEYERMLP